MNLPADRAELINPSDPISVSIADPMAICAAVLITGNGAYGVSGYDKETIALFGDRTKMLDDAWRARFGVSLEEGVASVSNERLAVAFESFRLERADRSSMNDIVGVAHKNAKRLREHEAKKVAKPVSGEARQWRGPSMSLFDHLMPDEIHQSRDLSPEKRAEILERIKALDLDGYFPQACNRAGCAGYSCTKKCRCGFSAVESHWHNEHGQSTLVHCAGCGKSVEVASTRYEPIPTFGEDHED